MSKVTKLQEMHILANSIRRTYNRLKHVTDSIHGSLELSAPKRTLLLDLYREGPLTVPNLASFRYVSRQITQTQINELQSSGYVCVKPNPKHKRSPLIALTVLGRKTAREMIDRESAFIEQLGWLPELDSLSECQQVLDGIYEALAS